MAVTDREIQEQAPQIFNLVKEARFNLVKNNLDPSKYKAAVIATADHSGSTESRGLYRRQHGNAGIIPQTMDIAFAAGLLFDDDGEIPASLFDNRVYELGNMNLRNCKNFMHQHERYGYGGTSYIAALEWIVREAGYGSIDLSGHSRHASLSTPFEGGRHWWGGKRKPASQPTATPSVAQQASESGLRVLAQAAYPTFAIFITDGEPQDDKDAIRAYLTAMSQLPIFVQFIGVGDCDFTFLEELDEELPERFVDNANFFDAKEVGHNQNLMLEKMLGEFPDYYRKAIDLGLVAPQTA